MVLFASFEESSHEKRDTKFIPSWGHEGHYLTQDMGGATPTYLWELPLVWANLQPTTYSHKCKRCVDLKNVHLLKTNISQKC